MRLMWLDTSCFLVELAGLRVVFDPYLESRSSFNPPPPTSTQLGDVDLVLVTHGHFDHFADAPSLLRSSPRAKLVASRELCGYVGGRLGVEAERLIPIEAGEEVSVGGLRIKATRAQHLSPLDVARWLVGDFSFQPSSRDELRRVYAERLPPEALRHASEVPTGPLQGYLLDGGSIRLWNPSETTGWLARLGPTRCWCAWLEALRWKLLG